MRIYKCLFWLTSILASLSLAIATIINCCYGMEYDFEENVCLAIFGSAALTSLSSLVTYYYEKRKTLKSILYNTAGLVKFLNKYQENLNLDQKIQFYLDYNDIDKHMWDADFEEISFLLDLKAQNKKYIYDNIYTPITNFNNAVSKYIWNFRWHIDGSGKNNEEMKEYVDKLETYLIKKVEKDIPIEYDENKDSISVSKVRSVSSKLSEDIYKELYGKYLTIMYGKKAGKKNTEARDNG